MTYIYPGPWISNTVGDSRYKEARTIRTLSVSVVEVIAHGQEHLSDGRQFFGCRFLVTTVSTSPTGNTSHTMMMNHYSLKDFLHLEPELHPRFESH